MNEKEKLLHKIANTLRLNVGRINENGLLNGKMGIILFFYHYGRHTGKEYYFNLADALLDAVYNQLSTLQTITFDQGAVGIAWGTRYLIRNKFIEGDVEEIFSEIDNILFQQYICDSQSQIPLSTIGLYVHSMIIDGIHIDKMEDLIFLLLNKYEFYFLGLSSPIKPFTYINSVLFVLSTLRRYTKFQLKVEKIIFKILLYLSDLDYLEQRDTNDLKTLNRLLLSLEYSSEEKDRIINKLAALQKPSNFDTDRKYLWQQFIYFPDEAMLMEYEKLNTFIDDNHLHFSKGKELSIHNGLSGIGLNLLNPL